MKSLVILSLVAACSTHATAQPSSKMDWTKPVIGVDAPVPVTPEDKEIPVDLIYDGAVRIPALVPPIAIENPEAAADTPLPPPCEAPLPRSPTQPPGPPAPSPAPCRP